MKRGGPDYVNLITKLHDFCINCGDNTFMVFVWSKTIQRLQTCNEEEAIKIIDYLKRDEILKVDGRKLIFNKNTHRNMKFINT